MLIDSNQIKTEVFGKVAALYGDAVAKDVVAHHRSNGGVSRYEKFDRMFAEVLGRPPRGGEREEVLTRFAQLSREGAASSTVDPAAPDLLRTLKSRGGHCSVVSGGDQEDVQWILRGVGLDRWFDGIYGSPRTKSEILDWLIAEGLDPMESVFVGDSRLDLEVSLERGMTAVFVSHWSEFADWQAFVAEHPEVIVVEDLGFLLRMVRSAPARRPGQSVGEWLRSAT